jgi:uncharacterized protein (DUF362 family)
MFSVPTSTTREVFLIKTANRNLGVKVLMSRFNLSGFSGKKVALKANFNGADPFPASTHTGTLGAVVKALQAANVAGITLAERSGMGNTRRVLEETGVFDLSKKLGFKAVVLDELTKDEWVKTDRPGTHWLRGFYIAKLFAEADKVVQTCCLKAHRFGGHFTMSLKNSVGVVAKKVPGSLYDYMWELHSSPNQRKMVAEINSQYKTDIVVMDGIKAFVDGGPEQGKTVEPNLMIASADRVAIDAVGVAILRSYESTSRITNDKIFGLDQIRRASELEIGVKSAAEVNVTPVNKESEEAANQITGVLDREG